MDLYVCRFYIKIQVSAVGCQSVQLVPARVEEPVCIPPQAENATNNNIKIPVFCASGAASKTGILATSSVVFKALLVKSFWSD